MGVLGYNKITRAGNATLNLQHVRDAGVFDIKQLPDVEFFDPLTNLLVNHGGFHIMRRHPVIDNNHNPFGLPQFLEAQLPQIAQKDMRVQIMHNDVIRCRINDIPGLNALFPTNPGQYLFCCGCTHNNASLSNPGIIPVSEGLWNLPFTTDRKCR